jgi:Ham1 family
MRKIGIRYATSSSVKQQEVEEILRSVLLNDPHGQPIRAGDAFEFEFLAVATDEPLERCLEAMVRHKARSAYRHIMAPCIVEHAGLVLERFEGESYPGVASVHSTGTPFSAPTGEATSPTPKSRWGPAVLPARSSFRSRRKP